MGGTNRQSERPRLSITFLARKGYSRLSPVSSADGRGLLWAMSGDTVLITGAGFSKPAGGPLLKDLLTPDFLRKSNSDRDALDEVRSAMVFFDETLFTEILRMMRTHGQMSTTSGERWEASYLLKGLTTHLASVCGDLRIRRRTHLWNTYTEYLRWLRNNSRSLTVVTFNYDFLLEHLFDDIRVRYEYGKRTGIEYDDASRRSAIRRSLPFRRVQVLKLHGSANWGVCRGCRKAKAQDDMVVAFEKSFIPRRKRTCPRCKINPMESGIIPPILEKSGESRHTGLVWAAARQALRRAREIVVIGYSLPPTDHEALSLLQEIALPPSRPRVTLVCGPKGAPETYSQLLSRPVDTKLYFEAYAASVAH